MWRCVGALILCGAGSASAHDGFGYPDWIRLKDSVATSCRVLSENSNEVEVVMSGGQGEERIKIDRTQIEWLQRNSVPQAVQNKGGVRLPAGRTP